MGDRAERGERHCSHFAGGSPATFHRRAFHAPPTGALDRQQATTASDENHRSARFHAHACSSGRGQSGADRARADEHDASEIEIRASESAPKPRRWALCETRAKHGADDVRSHLDGSLSIGKTVAPVHYRCVVINRSAQINVAFARNLDARELELRCVERHGRVQPHLGADAIAR
jgi:hypothetical protein